MHCLPPQHYYYIVTTTATTGALPAAATLSKGNELGKPSSPRGKRSIWHAHFATSIAPIECTALDLGSSSLQCRTAGHMIHILDYTVRHDEKGLLVVLKLKRFSELNPAPFPERPTAKGRTGKRSESEKAPQQARRLNACMSVPNKHASQPRPKTLSSSAFILEIFQYTWGK